MGFTIYAVDAAGKIVDNLPLLQKLFVRECQLRNEVRFVIEKNTIGR